nr:MAG TPA: hypothetical protein [Caudoviricetes sp.]
METGKTGKGEHEAVFLQPCRRTLRVETATPA